jgi:Ca-activated chloride channel family protein
VVAKRMLFVLDRSGSMGGEKIVQAKDALKFTVNNLNEGDVFNIIDFSTDVQKFSVDPVAVTASSRQEALNYIDRLSAGGGTNINEALLSALNAAQADNLANMVIFLTDGQPTVGVTDNELIRQNVGNGNTNDARLFVFGVGYDVNTHLLDNLSGENRGVSTYVRPNENIEVAVSSFFSKINHPVLSDLALDYGSISIYDFFPKELPDLFKGSQIIEFGRYGTAAIRPLPCRATSMNKCKASTLIRNSRPRIQIMISSRVCGPRAKWAISSTKFGSTGRAKN